MSIPRMDDDQLERELAALEGAPAADEKPSETSPKTPDEGEEGQVETETGETEDDETDAGDDAGEDDADPDEDEKPKPKKKASGSERLKRRLEAAERELQTLRRAPTGANGEPTQDAIEAEIGKPPVEADYNGDFLAFERALTAYELDKRQATRALKGRATQAQQAREIAKADLADAHKERLAEFADRVPDFKATLKASSDLKATAIVEELILESEKSAHLVYHLAKNPDRLARLNQMSEREAAREIGRIESRLSLPNPKTQTKAPKPVAPPKGGAAPSSPDKDLDAWLKSTYGG